MQLFDEEAQAAMVLRGYRETRTDFGLNRIKLGSFLYLIRENKLWQGLAESWEEFLGAENINPNAARQYINVAKKFVYELDLDDETLRKLASAGISALEKAGKVINQSNKEEMINALVSLSERDAIQRIIEISSGNEELKPNQPSLRVLKILKEYYELPPDLQMDFKTRLMTERRKGQILEEGDKQVRPSIAMQVAEALARQEEANKPKSEAAQQRSSGFRRRVTST